MQLLQSHPQPKLSHPHLLLVVDVVVTEEAVAPAEDVASEVHPVTVAR